MISEMFICQISFEYKLHSKKTHKAAGLDSRAKRLRYYFGSSLFMLVIYPAKGALIISR